ncbi:hypothetical protein GCM10025876_15710 [Demequina litorisediminis]|uniref:Phosphoribosylformylglycinamidine cyclo-ligase n=1 Tax=Demequina litorisediminis TaxID=1849022 RepID=A0ABQ6IC14_9MICO|nr:hypothetical protein GCM10025876_15710 [Demequina litorisediminis]
MTEPITYAGAGVDTEAGDKAVEPMKSAVARTHGPEVLGGVGAFAGLFDASALKAYDRPLLASSTDGVGTKIVIARALDVHHTIGQDLVAMVVDDIVVCGAKPLVMTDYIACGKVVPERIADIVRGIAEGCEIAGVALVGGETAEHPGVMDEDDYDVAGAAVGVVEAADVLGAERVRTGDVVVAMASSGLHSNGYSLVRRVVSHAGWQARDPPRRPGPHRGRGAPRAHPHLLAGCASRSRPPCPACAPSRMSPAAASPRMWPAFFLRASPPMWRAMRGICPPCSPWCRPQATCRGTTSSRR